MSKGRQTEAEILAALEQVEARRLSRVSGGRPGSGKARKRLQRTGPHLARPDGPQSGLGDRLRDAVESGRAIGMLSIVDAYTRECLVLEVDGHVESFSRTVARGCLNINWFRNLFEARWKIAAWRTEHNQERPTAWSIGRRRNLLRELGAAKQDGGGTIRS